MDEAAKRFARRILLLHVLLLLGVLALVGLTSREIYHSTRNGVIEQAKIRQELLANQTARGIESQYQSVLNNLDLFRRVENDDSTTQPAAGSAAAAAAQQRSLFDRFMERVGGGGTRLANGRPRNNFTGTTRPTDVAAAQGFPNAARSFGDPSRPGFDNNNRPGGEGPPQDFPRNGPPPDGPNGPARPPDNGPPSLNAANERPNFARTGTPGGQGREGDRPFNNNRNGQPAGNATVQVRVRGAFGPNQIDAILWKQLEGRVSLLFSIERAALDQDNTFITPIGSEDAHVTAAFVVAQSRAWLAGVTQPSVSEFQMYDGIGANLVCIPFPRGRLLVAVVPIRIIEQKFLAGMNEDPHTAAWLIDDRLTAMAASRSRFAGASMSDISDPSVRQMVADYTTHGREATQRVDHNFRIGGASFTPSLVSAEPIHVAGKTWELFISTGTDEIDGLVSAFFHRALIWGTIVVIVITGLLVSTAVQLIRSRTRLERVRHEMLTRELSQARQIQLAWLPEQQPASPRIEIAAVNTPASHISGDFYNWFDLDDGRTVITIGDVTGHGMAAAFLMATTQLLVRNSMPRLHGDPAACLEDVNRQLCTQVFNGQFVTMLIAVLDCDSGQMQLATAGHPSPIVSDGKTFSAVELEPQLVLGVDPHAKYHNQAIDLSGTRKLLLYTDGVVDCLAHTGLRFGTDGLMKSVRASKAGAKDLLDCVVTSVEQFRHRCELTDDLTLVAVQTQVTAPRKPRAPQLVEA